MIALGADTVNSARGMMLALGCIQSRSCNTDQCPTGIATQDPARYKALDIEDKSQRVANYQTATVRNLAELLEASGLEGLDELKPEHINRRVSGTDVATYAELYPVIQCCCLLDTDNAPDRWKAHWESAFAEHW